MELKNIELINFRNYKYQKIEFINGINLFVGNNAQGKTNIIESIYISSFGKSYRTIKDNEIINFESEFSKINLEYNKGDINNKINYSIDKLNRKNIIKNDVKIRKISEHVGEIPIVLFSPDSLDIVKGAPAKRRDFINMIASQLSKNYLIALQEYNKCLKIKNSCLKKEFIDREYLKILNEKMSVYIEKIVNFRKLVIEKILEKAKIIEANVTNGKEELFLKYETDFFDMNSKQINEILNRYMEVEIIKKSSMKGIQRDDIIIYVNGLEVAKYGSQGQNRTALLSLKLADYEVLKEVKRENPILLLDDIMSELDGQRISYLLKYIENCQSIITTTDSSFVKEVKNIKISKVLSGRLEI